MRALGAAKQHPSKAHKESGVSTAPESPVASPSMEKNPVCTKLKECSVYNMLDRAQPIFVMYSGGTASDEFVLDEPRVQYDAEMDRICLALPPIKETVAEDSGNDLWCAIDLARVHGPARRHRTATRGSVPSRVVSSWGKPVVVAATHHHYPASRARTIQARQFPEPAEREKGRSLLETHFKETESQRQKGGIERWNSKTLVIAARSENMRMLRNSSGSKTARTMGERQGLCYSIARSAHKKDDVTGRGSFPSLNNGSMTARL
jgi:hypothetical protein